MPGLLRRKTGGTSLPGCSAKDNTQIEKKETNRGPSARSGQRKAKLALRQRLSRQARALLFRSRSQRKGPKPYPAGQVNDMRPLGYTMWEAVSFTKHERRGFEQGKQLEVLLKHTVVTGATLAFRSSLAELVLPIPETWVHDAWIALVATALSRRGILVEEPLVLYRQHSGQTIGGRRVGLLERFRQVSLMEQDIHTRESDNLRQALARLSPYLGPQDETHMQIQAKISLLQARRSLYNASLGKRTWTVCQQLTTGRYHRFANGWRSALKDLFLIRIRNG
jgi:hypothetical protein